MELKFLGRGSAFNVTEGNNSCFYKNNKNQILLIDCGESVFSKIVLSEILKDINQIFVAITHTHSDHVGSLGSLALYSFFKLNKKINLVLTPSEVQNNAIKTLCKIMGIADHQINIIEPSELLKNFDEFENFEFVKTSHVEEFESFGIVITHKTDGVVYYSSDTNSTEHLEKFLNHPNLHKIYVDTSKADYPGNVHISSKILADKVEPKLRHKVYCMHIDDSKHIDYLKHIGFNVVEVI